MDSPEPAVEALEAQQQAVSAVQQSLYDASPTPSDEGFGGASPVKARMATRFFTPPNATTPPPPAAAAVLAGCSKGACCSSSSAGMPARTPASMQHLSPPAGHLQDSIYSSRTGSFSPASASNGVRRPASAPPHGKGKLLHSQNTAGSHLSLLDVEHLEGTEVGPAQPAQRRARSSCSMLFLSVHVYSPRLTHHSGAALRPRAAACARFQAPVSRAGAARSQQLTCALTHQPSAQPTSACSKHHGGTMLYLSPKFVLYFEPLHRCLLRCLCPTVAHIPRTPSGPAPSTSAKSSW